MAFPYQPLTPATALTGTAGAAGHSRDGLPPGRKRRLFRRMPRRLSGGALQFGNRGGDDLVATYVTVAISNPADPERVWEGEFLVDTGAMNTLAPRQHLAAIGIAPAAQRAYTLADGSEIQVDFGGGLMDFLGESTYGDVLFGGEDVTPLLGVTALGSVGIEVDPHNGTLKKLPAIRLPGYRPRFR